MKSRDETLMSRRLKSDTVRTRLLRRPLIRLENSSNGNGMRTDCASLENLTGKLRRQNLRAYWLGIKESVRYQSGFDCYCDLFYLFLFVFFCKRNQSF